VRAFVDHLVERPVHAVIGVDVPASTIASESS
jgi:hypothetical protein